MKRDVSKRNISKCLLRQKNGESRQNECEFCVQRIKSRVLLKKESFIRFPKIRLNELLVFTWNLRVSTPLLTATEGKMTELISEYVDKRLDEYLKVLN